MILYSNILKLNICWTSINISCKWRTSPNTSDHCNRNLHTL